MRSVVRTVRTPRGPARFHISRASRSPRAPGVPGVRSPIATLVVSHGAGGGVDAPDLVALATQLPGAGISVLRFEQPWRVAGKKIAPAPTILDEALLAAVRTLRPRTPMFLGGRSAGARAACRSAAELGASGVLALSFPLHPPGKPERSRLEELLTADVPVLVIQGESDPFGGPGEFPAGTDLVVVPGGDHSFKVPRRVGVSPEQAMDIIVQGTIDWITRLVGNLD